MIFMESEHLKPGAQTSMTQTIQFRRLGRSIAAVLIGMAVGVLVTVGTDFALHAAGLFPPWDQRVSNALLLLATGYRTIYSVAASYLTAYLAPYRPLAHALVGGAFGFLASAAGAVATWNAGPAFQIHWYPVALVILAIPQAWVGGWLRVRQLKAKPAFAAQ